MSSQLTDLVLVFIANPILSTREEIQGLVLEYPPNTASPFRNDEVDLLIVHRPG